MESRLPVELPSPVAVMDYFSQWLAQIRTRRPRGTGDWLMSPYQLLGPASAPEVTRSLVLILVLGPPCSSLDACPLLGEVTG